MSDARPFAVAVLFVGLLLGGCTSSSDGLTLAGLDAATAGGRDASPTSERDQFAADPPPPRPSDAGGRPVDAPPPTAGRADAASLDAGGGPRPDAAASAGRADGPLGTPRPTAVPPQCARDADCQLVNDCCNCVALPRTDKAPVCDSRIACAQTVCMQFGALDQPRCVAGRCVLGLDCDASTVACKRVAPACPAGQVPRIIGGAGARCYGECVDARQCLSVPSCAGCAKDDACVIAGDGATWHCVPGVKL